MLKQAEEWQGVQAIQKDHCEPSCDINPNCGKALFHVTLAGVKLERNGESILQARLQRF